MFKEMLKEIIVEEHLSAKPADMVERKGFKKKPGPTLSEDSGRPGLSIWLMVGLHCLKYAYSLSVEAVVEGWLEDPYWQHFCGGILFEHKFSIDLSNMTRFRGRPKKAGGDAIGIGLDSARDCIAGELMLN